MEKIECAVCEKLIELSQELFRRGLGGEPLCAECEEQEVDWY